jgi:tetratricopeptide (TPR) repeat protein
MKKTLLLFAIASIITNVFSQSRAEALFDEGTALYDQGKYAEAIDKYKESYKLDSNNIVLFSEMAMAYMALQDFPNTEYICQKAINKFPNDPDLKSIYSTYGNSFDKREKPEEALKIYEQGLAKFPKYYMLYYNKGISEFNLKKHYDARVSFQASIKLNPTHAGSYFHLSVVEDYFENRISAILCLARYLVLEPKGKRTERILPYFTKKVNELYYRAKKDGVTIVKITQKNRFDKDPYIFEQLEQGILDIETKLLSTPEVQGQPDYEKLAQKMQTICENLKVYKKDNTDFYWTYLAPYFIELESKKYVTAFTYYINSFVGVNKAVAEKWIEQNKQEADAFIAWNESYKWQ